MYIEFETDVIAINQWRPDPFGTVKITGLSPDDVALVTANVGKIAYFCSGERRMPIIITTLEANTLTFAMDAGRILRGEAMGERKTNP